MRIIMITSKLNFITGGGSVLDLDLTARTFQKLGHEVKFVTVFSSYNNFPSDLPYFIHAEQIVGTRQLKIQWGIFNILRKYEQQADIFYIEAHALLYGAGLYRRLGGQKPIVAFFNRELVAWPEDRSTFFSNQISDTRYKRLRRLLRWYFEKYFGMPVANGIDLITFTNPFLQKGYSNFGMKRKSNMITGDPFDFEKIMNENNITPMSYRQRNKIKGPIKLFYSSRMAPGKGFDLLITAFSKVKNKKNFRLIIGGSGPEENKVRELIKKLRLENFIELPGWVSREALFQSLKTVDIFIQPRWRTDMTSTSLLFAMAFGLPSILPAGGGLQWVADQSGYYFNDGDPDDLARSIETLGSQYNKRAMLSAACYERLSNPEINYKVVLPKLLLQMQNLLR